jgi:Spy/CpxP family protein refolding chaperone
MKRLIMLAVVSAVCMGLVSSCVCSKGEAKPCKPAKCSMAGKEGMSIDKCPVMSKLNLTDEQKAKVQAICDGCSKEKCSKKACKKMTAELEKVLTPEQMTQYKAACEEMKKEGKCGKKSCCKKSDKAECPAKKADSTQESK